MDASAELSGELDRLAFDLEVARDFRRLVSLRLGLIAVGTLLLAALKLVPWIAGDVALAVTVFSIAVAFAMESRARHRLMRSTLARHLRVSGDDSSPD